MTKKKYFFLVIPAKAGIHGFKFSGSRIEPVLERHRGCGMAKGTMIKFEIASIHPQLLSSYFKEAILARGIKKKLLQVNLRDLRVFGVGPHQKLDDRAYGGGPGMILMLEPVYKLIKKYKIKKGKSRVLLLSPRGKKFTQGDAKRYAKLDQVMIICGRYEGIDERIADYLSDEVVSLGDFVLMGGELAAAAIVDATARFVPGVIGRPEEIKHHTRAKQKGRREEIFSRITGSKDFPQYTKPREFAPVKGKKKWSVPEVLLGGHHKKIQEWRDKHSTEFL